MGCRWSTNPTRPPEGAFRVIEECVACRLARCVFVLFGDFAMAIGGEAALSAGDEPAAVIDERDLDVGRPEVDAEHMFGFSEGTDIGVPFQPEGELETIGRVGRQSGAYGAFTTTANLKYPLSPQWRIAPGIDAVAAIYHLVIRVQSHLKPQAVVGGIAIRPDLTRHQAPRTFVRWRPQTKEQGLTIHACREVRKLGLTQRLMPRFEAS